MASVCQNFNLNFLFILIFLFNYFFYNVVLVFAIQQCKSSIIIHTPPSSLTSLPPTTFHPSMSSQCTRLGSLCYTAQQLGSLRYTAIHLTSESAYKVGATFFIHPTLCHPQIQNMKLFICH